MMKAACSSGIILIFIFSMASLTSAKMHIGIILDGYQQNCTVQSDNEEYDCLLRRQLFAGDKVVKKPDISKLKIKWAPYATGKKLDKTAVLVVFDPPKDKSSVAGKIGELLGLVKEDHRISVGATRGGADIAVGRQPCNNATVIPGQKITFIDNTKSGSYIEFNDRKGIGIFIKEIKNKKGVALTPEEIGIKPDEVYTWNFGKDGNNSAIRLLDADIAQQIISGLIEIDKENNSVAGKHIKKAAYVQFMSEMYPEDMDLYWLSYQILGEIREVGILNEDDKRLMNKIRDTYLLHVAAAGG